MNDVPIEPLPPGPADDDLIAACEHAASLRQALDAATAAAAFDDTPEMDRAASVIRPFASRGCLDADDAASAAHRCLPGAMGLAPTAWNTEMPRLSAPIARLWRRFEAERWTEPLFTGRATACLARRMIDPNDVARQIADGLDPARPVVLLGFEENGRRLAHLLVACGMIVSARDDSVGTPMIEEVGAGLVVVGPGCAPLHAQAQYVCTQADDGAMVDRLPVCLDLVRWSEAREALFARTAMRLLVSWPMPERARKAA